ncbi:MAG: hypothetical protein ABL998_08505 [Planctomycetota bacterium]
MNGTPYARGTGGEAWLLCPGGELAAALAAFDSVLPALVLAQDEPQCARFGAAFAAAGGSALELVPAGTPLALALEQALVRSAGRVLCLSTAPLASATVAHVLGLAAGGARVLRLDPGRAFLLRDERVGFVLRHANVGGPEREPGTRLPLWKSAP